MSFDIKDLFNEINLLRTNPSEFSEKISKSKEYFKGNIWIDPETKAGIQTAEGPAAYDEAIEFLKNASPVEELKPSKGLMNIANDMLELFQKDANDRTDINSIIDKYGSYGGSFRRSVEFGAPNAEQAIINLVVCDGNKSRGNREALLDENLEKIGIASGKHGTYRTCSVIVGCTNFENSDDSDDTAYI